MAGQPFTFTVRGSGLDPATMIVRFSGLGCPTPCSTKSLTGSPSELNGAMALPGGAFTVSVATDPDSTESNTVALTVSTGAGPAAKLSAIAVDPNPPVGGQPFTFKLSGEGFDPGTTIVDFSGPGCEAPCLVRGLTGSPVQLEGAAALTPGAFTVKVRNGDTGTPSNSLSLTIPVITVETPSLADISTSPNPPVQGQPFTFTANGSGFNPATTIAAFSGPGCETPCIVHSLTGSSRQLSGATVLPAGAFTVTLRNGPDAGASNSLTVRVQSEVGEPAKLTSVTAVPNPPSANLPFSFAVRGSGLNPASTVIEFSGPGCTTPCSVTGLAGSSTQLNGATLLSSGSFTVKVRNGAKGTPSNGVVLTVR